MAVKSWIVLMALVLGCVGAECEDIDAKLASLLNQVVNLREPCAADKILFTPDGMIVGKHEAANRLSASAIYIKQITADKAKQQLKLSGQRGLLVYDLAKQDFQVVLTDRSVKIAIELNNVEYSEAIAALKAIFLTPDKQQSAEVAFIPDPDSGNLWENLKKNPDHKPVGVLSMGRPVYVVEPGIIRPPKALRTPDPEYPDFMKLRNTQFSGVSVLYVIINEKGDPEILSVKTTGGRDLDNATMVAVADWKFEPAVKDGTPVAVLINVEMNFRGH